MEVAGVDIALENGFEEIRGMADHVFLFGPGFVESKEIGFLLMAYGGYGGGDNF